MNPQDIVLVLYSQQPGTFAWQAGPGANKLTEAEINLALDQLKTDVIASVRLAAVAKSHQAVRPVDASALNILNRRNGHHT